MTRLLACVGHIKQQTALSLAYGTGSRWADREQHNWAGILATGDAGLCAHDAATLELMRFCYQNRIDKVRLIAAVLST